MSTPGYTTRGGAKLRTDRLAKLSAHLRGKIGHTKFNFSAISDSHLGRRKANGCGTCGCAMGELPVVFPDQWKFRPAAKSFGCSPRTKRSLPLLTTRGASMDLRVSTCEFFGITGAEANHLFYPGNQSTGAFGGSTLDTDATKEEVADNIDAFIEFAKAGKLEEAHT